jgi:pimeloyl-ACP methyl ester carboxylesterase
MTQLSTSPPASIRTEASYADLPTDHLSAGNGVEYAYRRYGANTRPLVFLQHFRGNLDSWDPALADQIARSRQVVCFDNTGVGGSGGATPRPVRQMASDAIEFLDALEVDDVDLLGFSLGSFVAQEVALIRPNLVKRMILASAAPQGASGMHGWAPDVISAVGAREVSPSGFLDVFYTQSATSRGTGMASLQRITARTKDRDETTSWQTRLAQYDAVCTWGIPNHSLLARVTGIKLPVFVANGDSDPMILPRYSYLLAGLLPDAQLKIYPDAAHGFLFQHHDEFAADVLAFLADES